MYTKPVPLVLPRCTKSHPFFLWKRTKIPSELLWNSNTLVMSSAQGREVYIMVISIICTPAATGNELITKKIHPVHKKCVDCPAGPPKQDAVKQLEFLFCPDPLFCLVPFSWPSGMKMEIETLVFPRL